MSSQQLVVLAPPINQIFLKHLHCLIAIFTLPYYYIYNDFFSVIHWKQWCNLGVTQIYIKFLKKIYKLFLWIPVIREIYIQLFTNYSEIKKKQNPHKEVREERLSQGVPCSCSCVRQGHSHRHDCLLDTEAERTHAQRRITRTHAHDRRRGEADASASYVLKNGW